MMWTQRNLHTTKLYDYTIHYLIKILFPIHYILKVIRVARVRLALGIHHD